LTVSGTRTPAGMTYTPVTASAPYTKDGSYLAHGTALLGVYQKLATRAGGEVVSADAYCTTHDARDNPMRTSPGQNDPTPAPARSSLEFPGAPHHHPVFRH